MRFFKKTRTWITSLFALKKQGVSKEHRSPERLPEQAVTTIHALEAPFMVPLTPIPWQDSFGKLLAHKESSKNRNFRANIQPKRSFGYHHFPPTKIWKGSYHEISYRYELQCTDQERHRRVSCCGREGYCGDSSFRTPFFWRGYAHGAHSGTDPSKWAGPRLSTGTLRSLR